MDTESRRKIWENIFQLSQAVFRVTHLFPQEEILRRHLRAKATEILYQASQSVIASEAKQSRYTFPIINHLPLANALHNFRGLLFSAKSCDFVNEQNFTILIKECAKIIETLESSPCHPYDSSCHPDPRDVCHPRDHSCHPRAGGDPDLILEQIQNDLDSPDFRSRGNDKKVAISIQNSIQPAIGFFTPNPRQQKLLDYLQKCQDEKLQLKDIAEEFKNVQPRTIRQDLKELCDGGYLTRNGHGAGSYYIFPKNNTS